MKNGDIEHRVLTATGNIARSVVRNFSPADAKDDRPCRTCGGQEKHHGIYGTFEHMPDLDKPLPGFAVATAFCDKFEPAI